MDNLKDTLDICALEAENAVKHIKEENRKLNSILESASKNIKESILENKKRKVIANDLVENLNLQLQDIDRLFNDMNYNFEKELNQKEARLKKFTISLFGRTMAGKSTLMEILTNGNGETIGRGAQRTTRDVREYTWNNLSIIDVPGVAAFDGKDDETVAYEAAKNADMVIFLMTDQGAQVSEAKWLLKVKALGKPVLVLVNVNQSVDTNDDIRDITDDINERFNLERLNGVVKQFKEFAEVEGLSWENVRFVYAHLRSAFLAQREPNRRKAKQLNWLSRFDFVKKEIVKIIVERGAFYRYKAFYDILTRWNINIQEMVALQALQNSKSGRIFNNKINDIKEWKKFFYTREKEEINHFCNELELEMYRTAVLFVDKNYENTEVGKAWEKEVNRLDINSKVDRFVKKQTGKVNDKIKEFFEELSKELEFSKVNYVTTNIAADTIIDWRRGCVYGGNAIVFCVLLYFVLTNTIPGGWIVLGISLLPNLMSRFFDSKAERIKKAKKKLLENLEKSNRENIEKIRKVLLNRLDNDIMNNCIYKLEGDFRVVVNNSFKLADLQRSMYESLNKELLKINKALFFRVAQRTNLNVCDNDIKNVARIPGDSIFVLVNDEIYNEVKKSFNFNKRQIFKNVIQEDIYLVADTSNYKELARKIIGKYVSIEEKIKTIHIKLGSQDRKVFNKIRIVQQLTGYIVQRN